MDCPLYLSGQQVGVLRVTPEGRDTRFTVCASAPCGLYRVSAKGERGDLLLGTWQGDDMSRRFSRELTAPVGQIHSAVAFPVDGAGEPWGSALAERFPGWPVAGGLCRKRGEGWELALPFDEDGPFPLPQLFCLARVMRVMGRQCAVFRFNGAGRPIFPTIF